MLSTSFLRVQFWVPVRLREPLIIELLVKFGLKSSVSFKPNGEFEFIRIGDSSTSIIAFLFSASVKTTTDFLFEVINEFLNNLIFFGTWLITLLSILFAAISDVS